MCDTWFENATNQNIFLPCHIVTSVVYAGQQHLLLLTHSFNFPLQISLKIWLQINICHFIPFHSTSIVPTHFVVVVVIDSVFRKLFNIKRSIKPSIIRTDRCYWAQCGFVFHRKTHKFGLNSYYVRFVIQILALDDDRYD